MPLDARHRGPHFAMPCVSCNHDIEFLWQTAHNAGLYQCHGDFHYMVIKALLLTLEPGKQLADLQLWGLSIDP